MKCRFDLLLLILTAMVTCLSCQKASDSPTPKQIDSLKASLPKQIIDTYTYDSVGQVTSNVTHTYAISIKYDTINHRIDLYGDDTTNTNPYDVLVATYKYNSNGYLISFTQSNLDYGSRFATEFTATINRNPDNTISNIVVIPAGGAGVDSILYIYRAANGGNSISTITRSYDNQVLSGTNTLAYYYATDNRLIKVVNEDQGTYTYSYNSNNSLQSFSLQGAGISINGNYSYSSGLPDGKADVFLQTLLGKDYYLFDLKTFDPFILSVDADFENSGNSITDPYHVTNATELGNITNSPFTISASWVYQVNDQNNVTKVIYKGATEMHTYILKY